MAEIELIARAGRRQNAIAEREQEWMTHDVDRERRGDARHAGDLLGERAVKGLHERIEQRFVGVGGRNRVLDLRVDPRHDVEGEQTLDDGCAVAFDRRANRVRTAVGAESFEAGTHVASFYERRLLTSSPAAILAE